MSAYPVLVGIAATVLAALQLLVWMALGSFAMPRTLGAAGGIPASVLIGSGVCATLYAVLSLARHIDAALLLVSVAGFSALVIRRGWVADSLKELWRGVDAVLRGRRQRIIGAVLLALYWVDSVVPPRDGDVMRYHLAHIRQIIRDGHWAALPDYTYALPFGWTLDYLPFERLHLPQAAHLSNLGLWLIAMGVLASILGSRGAPRVGFLLLLLVALQPLVLKSATTAFADMYGVFVVLGVVVLLYDRSAITKQHMMTLGFVSTIGAQSRYQLLGVSVSVLVIGIVWLVRRRIDFRLFGAAALGALAGLALASPFYLVNLVALHNPVWPLMIRKFNDLGVYANAVAENVNRSLAGELTIGGLLISVRSLMTDRIVFPIPLLAAASLAAPLWSRDQIVRTLSLFNAVFLLVWAVVQPSLYSRFIILLVPSIVLALALSLKSVARIRPFRWSVSIALVVGVIGFFTFDLYYSRDSARYVATADADTFHEATWFYPVYKWVNDSTPAESRFLVIVASGHSYYLDRSYRKADPFLSGYVNWDAVSSDKNLRTILKCAGFDYVIYDARDWGGQPGGKHVNAAFSQAISDGSLAVIKSFDVQLITSRVGGEGERTKVFLLRYSPSPIAGECRGIRAAQPFLD